MRPSLHRAALLAALLALAGPALAQGRLAAPAASPNPHTAGPLTLRYDAAAVGAPAVEVFDLLGRRVDPASALAAGAYFYRLRWADGAVSAAGRLTKLTVGPLDLRLAPISPAAAPVAEPAVPGGVAASSAECAGSPEGVLYSGLHHTASGGATLLPVPDDEALEVVAPPGGGTWGWSACLGAVEGVSSAYDGALPFRLQDGADSLTTSAEVTWTSSDGTAGIAKIVSNAAGFSEPAGLTLSSSLSTEVEVVALSGGVEVLRVLLPSSVAVQLSDPGGNQQIALTALSFVTPCAGTLENCDGVGEDDPVTAVMVLRGSGADGGVVVTAGSQVAFADQLRLSPVVTAPLSEPILFEEAEYVVTGADAGGGPHVRVHGPLKVLKRMDKASPLLYRALWVSLDGPSISSWELDTATPTDATWIVCITHPCPPATFSYGAPLAGSGIPNDPFDVSSTGRKRSVRLDTEIALADDGDAITFAEEVLEDTGTGTLSDNTYSVELRRGCCAGHVTVLKLFDDGEEGARSFTSYDAVYRRNGRILRRLVVGNGEVVSVMTPQPLQVVSWSFGAHQGGIHCGGGLGNGRCGARLEVEILGPPGDDDVEEIYLLPRWPTPISPMLVQQGTITTTEDLRIAEICGPCVSAEPLVGLVEGPAEETLYEEGEAAAPDFFEVVDASVAWRE